jgi:hypothetical protein
MAKKRKGLGRAIKRTAQKVGGAVKKTAQKVGRAAKAVGRNVVLAPVLPLLPTIAVIYKARTKKNPPAEPYKLVLAFARDVLKMNVRGYDLEPATLAMIVSAIIAFIRNLKQKAKEKQQAGAALSPEEAASLGANTEDAAAAQGSEEDLAQIGALLPQMREIYKAKTGKDLPEDPFEAVRVFYVEVVLPSQGKGFGFDYDHFAATSTELEFAYAYEAEYNLSQKIDFKTALAGVIAFFKAIRDRVREKQARGEAPGKVESTIADKVDSAESQIREEVKGQIKEDIAVSIGRTTVKAAPLLLGGAVLIGAIYFLSRKR